MIIRDLEKLFHGQRYNSILLISYLSIIMLLANVMLQSQQNFENEQMHYASLWDGRKVYSTYDTLYEHREQETAYLLESGSQFRVQRYINELEADSNFPYYICGNQLVQITDTLIPASCKAFYSNGQDVNAHQVNERVMLDFPVAMLDGSAFTKDDYSWQWKDAVPVIMGYSWRDYVRVGDLLQGKLMTLDMSFRVIGIAEENTYFPLFDSLLYEDDYIIMPTLRCLQSPRDTDEDFIQKAFALQNASGYFRLDANQSLSELVSRLDAFSQQYGMFETKVMRVDQARLTTLAISSEKYRQIYIGLMISLGVCSMLSMITMCQAVIRKNARMFAIYYLTGMTPFNISLMLIAQFVSIVAASCALSVCITVIVFPGIKPIYSSIQMSVVALSIVSTFPALHIFLSDPISYLKKE